LTNPRRERSLSDDPSLSHSSSLWSFGTSSGEEIIARIRNGGLTGKGRTGLGIEM
jgi:hypothetical protein